MSIVLAECKTPERSRQQVVQLFYYQFEVQPVLL